MTEKMIATCVAARRLLEMADRVLGEASSRADRYTYVNVILSQWTEEIDPSLRADLRLSCYEQLFGHVAKTEKHVKND